MRHIAAIALLSLVALGAGPPEPDVRIIAHPALGISRIDLQLVRRTYLGQQVRVGDTLLVPAVLRDEVPQEAFTRRFLQRTPSQFTTYWRQQVFAGKGLPPKSFDSEEKLLDFVRRTRGAVAYVGAEASCEGVLILEIEG